MTNKYKLVHCRSCLNLKINHALHHFLQSISKVYWANFQTVELFQNVVISLWPAVIALSNPNSFCAETLPVKMMTIKSQLHSGITVKTLKTTLPVEIQ